MSECKVIAVLNRKGGVCKTTTTHNLGVALAQQSYRVLLVDWDTQRNLTMSMGLLAPDEEDNTLCELLQPFVDAEADEMDVHACIRRFPNGVDLIPNKQALSAIEKQIVAMDFRRECVLLDALEDARADYDFILLDCMASLGMLAVNVAMACDEVLLVSTPEEDSIEGLGLASDFIAEASRALCKQIPICGLLVCRMDTRYRKNRKGMEEIQKLFAGKVPIYTATIPDRVCVADARDRQLSVLEYAPDSEPTLAYGQVCREFLREVQGHAVRSA